MRYAAKDPADFANKKRGRDNEIRALAALRDLRAVLPPWIRTVRPANLQEDYEEQTDVVIETTDAGLIRIQIKSSLAGADRFKKEHPGLEDAILVIVVNQWQDQEKIRNRIVTAAMERRSRILREQKTLELERKRTEQLEQERRAAAHLEELVSQLPPAQMPKWVVSFKRAESGFWWDGRWNFQVAVKGGKEFRLQIASTQYTKRQRQELRSSLGPDVVLTYASLKDDQESLCKRIYCVLGEARADKPL